MRTERGMTTIRYSLISVVFIVFLMQSVGCLFNSATRVHDNAMRLAQKATTEVEIRKACQQYDHARALFVKEGDLTSVALMDEQIADLLTAIDPEAAGERYLTASELRNKGGDKESAYADMLKWYELSVTDDKISATDLEKIRRLAALSRQIDNEAGQIRWLMLLFGQTGDGRILEQLEALIKEKPLSRLSVEITLQRAIFHRGRGEAIASLSAFERAGHQAGELPDQCLELDIMIESFPLFSNLYPPRVNERLQVITTSLASPDCDVSNINRFVESLRELTTYNWVHWSFDEITDEWLETIIPRMSQTEGRRIALALSSLLHQHDGTGSEFLKLASALFNEEDSPSQWLEVAEAAVHVKNFEIVDELCRKAPFSSQLLEAVDLFRYRLLKVKRNVNAANIEKTSSEMFQAFTEYATHESVNSTTFLVQITEMTALYLELGNIDLAQQLFLRGSSHLPAIRDEIDIHGDYLSIGSHLYEAMGDIGHALDLAHNHYGIYARLAGYEVKKSELYERIGDLAIKSGYVDQKFNPYELALSLTKEIDIPGLVPALHVKIAFSHVFPDKSETQSVRSSLWTWFDETTLANMGSDWTDESMVLKILDFFMSENMPRDAAALLDQFSRRKGIHHALFKQITQSPLELTGTDHVMTEHERLDRFILFQRALRWLLETVRHRLRKATWSQGNVKDMIALWKAMEQRRNQLADKQYLEGFSLDLCVQGQGRQLAAVLKNIPESSEVLSLALVDKHGIGILFTHENIILGTKVFLSTQPLDKAGPRTPIDETMLHEMTTAFIDVVSSKKTSSRVIIVRNPGFPLFSITQLPKELRRIVTIEKQVSSMDEGLSYLQQK